VLVEKSGDLLVRADPVTNSNALGLIIGLGAAGFFLWNIITAMFRARAAGPRVLLLLLPMAFVCAWLIMLLRFTLERLCAVEICVSHERLSWSYGLMSFRRRAEVARHDIVAVRAKRRWYGNRLEIAARGVTFRLDNLLDEDLEEIAAELHRVLPEANSR
jgi:hypothetical protein